MAIKSSHEFCHENKKIYLLVDFYYYPALTYYALKDTKNYKTSCFIATTRYIWKTTGPRLRNIINLLMMTSKLI